jgi:prevent-host-death family protein
MTTVGVRALKQNASTVIAEAIAGEVVTITERGRPIAQLIPLPAGRLAELAAAGRARPPRRSLEDLPHPEPAVVPLSESVADMRDEERS